MACMATIGHPSGMRFLVLLPFALVACGPQWDEVDYAEPPPPVPDCPYSVPTDGSSCYQSQTCYYEPTGCSSSFLQATCASGRWFVSGSGACPDAGTDATSDAGTCPKDEPAIGSACTGTATCSYQNLCPLVPMKTNPYRCIGGKWSFDATLESPIDCPKDQPRDGQACGCAMYLPSKCAYTTSCGSVDAVCDGATQRWKVGSCASADAGSSDAASPSDAGSSSDAASSSDTSPSADASSDAASD